MENFKNHRVKDNVPVQRHVKQLIESENQI